jgi:hypothetical protein
MMKQVLIAAAFLVTAPIASAQTDCSTPVMKLLSDGKEIPATSNPFPPRMTLQVASEAGCPDQRFGFKKAELTLVRRGLPVLPSTIVSGPEDKMTLLEERRAYQPGDRLHAFIYYQNLFIVSADGKKMPYPRPKATVPNRGKLDLRTDEAKGISFNWELK